MSHFFVSVCLFFLIDVSSLLVQRFWHDIRDAVLRGSKWSILQTWVALGVTKKRGGGGKYDVHRSLCMYILVKIRVALVKNTGRNGRGYAESHRAVFLLYQCFSHKYT